MWQVGDKHYHEKNWKHAADWFLLATLSVLGSVSQISLEKCLRKATLCYFELQDYASALAMINQCSRDSASTCYLHFLLAIRQGWLSRLQCGAVSHILILIGITEQGDKLVCTCRAQKY